MKYIKSMLTIIVLSITGTFIVYPKLPPTIPLHWNIKGQINSYGSKYMILILALIPLAIVLLSIVIPKIDPKSESYTKHQTAYSITIFFTIIVLIAVHWFSILAALGYKMNINIFINIIIGLLFIVIGNFMTQIRHNYFFGIRTPWTLASEEVWKRTHRIGSYTFVICGIGFILSAFVPGTFKIILLFAIILTAVLIPIIYSYIIFSQLKK